MHIPEDDKVARWFNGMPQIALERVLSGVYSPESLSDRRMLLDCRGMSAIHNGTSHAMIGLLDGLQRQALNWRIDVLIGREAAEFFDFETRYPWWGLHYDTPVGTYAVAIMLNQPWWYTRVRELHEHALINVYNMLDTISWDIIYSSDDRLELIWKFIAQYSDGLLYISDFTRSRFRARFEPAKSVSECVSYLSLSADDYLDRDIVRREEKGHILVFGNDYDHKDVRRTVKVLSDAFPFRQIIAIGVEFSGLGNVRGIPSGHIEHSAIHQIIADASVLVLPSFYEGFGLPVIQGLAYGRPVVVRESELWLELADQMDMPGKLVVYRDTSSLIEAVGRLIRGHDCPSLKQGLGLGYGCDPLNWNDCAERILEFVEGLFRNAGADRWLEREYAFRWAQLMQL
jgi:glycosyltransferase involved in cell wall biosynthesis